MNIYEHYTNQRMTKTSFVSIRTITTVALFIVFGFFALSALADSAVAVDFEDPPYTLGTIDGQDGWIKTGTYDHEVSSGFGVPGFGTQSLRVSNAITSGAFDQTFAKPLADAAGAEESEEGAI